MSCTASPNVILPIHAGVEELLPPLFCKIHRQLQRVLHRYFPIPEDSIEEDIAWFSFL